MVATKLEVFGGGELDHRVLARAGEGTPVAEIASPCEVADLTKEQIAQINRAYFQCFKDLNRKIDDMQYYNWSNSEGEIVYE